VPGLYYIFGKLDEGRKLIKGEDDNPLTEAIGESQRDLLLTKKIKKVVTKMLRKNENKENI
jgi:hydrophobic/amphiphilic exporter-1 (mainly G- bacteria), HAE1 family